MLKRALKTLFLAPLLLNSPPAFAWSSSGHRIIAQIAAEHISPSTHNKIKNLLGSDDLQKAATWADAGRIADRTASAARELTDASTWGRAELWRFRPDMSLCRASATHCRATLRGATAVGAQP